MKHLSPRFVLLSILSVLLMGTPIVASASVGAGQSSTATTQTDSRKKTSNRHSKKSAASTASATPPATASMPATQPAATPPAPTTSSARTKSTASTAAPTPARTAPSSGMVWVNTQTGVYHSKGKWYGKTKQGKYMSESDAIKAGYKKAKD